MKKFVLLLIIMCLSVSLIACTVQQPEITTVAVTDASETQPYEPPHEANSDTVQLGNLIFPLTTGMSVEENIKNAQITITLIPNKSYVIMNAVDISKISNDKVNAFVQIQHKSFTKDFDHSCGVTKMNVDICSFPAFGEAYGVISNGTTKSCLDLSFTDTWYAYTFIYISHVATESDSFNYAQQYGEFLANTQYIGETPRDLGTSTTSQNTTPTKSTTASKNTASSGNTTNSGNIAVPESATVPKNTTTPESTTAPESAAPQIGEQNALRSAHNYLNVQAFSHKGLIKQLKYEGYTDAEATYAADNCGADWEKQAARAATMYLNVQAFSHQGLVKQLKYEGYSDSEATYAADNCGADWNKEAEKAAAAYLKVMPFSRNDLIKQLEYSGFTHEQAAHGADTNGL